MNQRTESPLIVGFGHRRRVGKDTLAGLVRDELNKAGITAYRDAFAWKLKDAARKLFDYAGLGHTDLYEREPERREEVLPALGKTPRELWIAFGHKMREIAPDVWIRGVLDNPAYDGNCVLLVSDVRYPNEVEAIRKRGGMVIKVTRAGVPESSDVADAALAAMGDDAWDRVIRNDGDLSRLSDMAEELVRMIRGRQRERTGLRSPVVQ